MERPIVDRRADPRSGECSDHVVARCARIVTNTDRKQMPGVQAAFGRQRGKIERQTAERIEVTKRRPLAQVLQGVGFGELYHAERGCNVSHVVFEARRNDVIGPRGANLMKTVESVTVEAMTPHESGARGNLWIARDEYPAFARGNRFVGVEAEDAGIRTPATDEATIAMGGKRVGRVLDNLQPVAVCKVQHRVHVAGKAAEMDGHDRLAIWRQVALSIGAVDDVRSWLDVDELDLRAEIAHYLRSRREGQRRQEHTVARSNATGLRSKMQPGGPGVHGDGFDAAAEKRRELLLEFAGFGACGQPAGAQDGGDRFDLIRGDRRPEEGNVHYAPRWRLLSCRRRACSRCPQRTPATCRTQKTE